MQQSLRISIISDADTWMNRFMPAVIARVEALGHAVRWVHAPADVPEGDLLFCLSCTKLLKPDVLARNAHTLVIHQSALPKGRGWSPLSWQVLEGATSIPVTLLEAAEAVDSGTVYDRDEIVLTGRELIDELHEGQAAASLRMILRFLADYPAVVARGEVQDEAQATYYPRRRADANQLDPDKTLREQFDLLRIVDNERYPAYFELDGETYVLKIERKHAVARTDWLEATVPAETPATEREARATWG